MALEAMLAVLHADLSGWREAENIYVPAAKILLMGMANHGDAEGRYIYPSVRRLEVYSGMGNSTVRRYLSFFQDIGLLEVVKPAHGPKPPEYRLDVHKLRHKKHEWLIEKDRQREGI